MPTKKIKIGILMGGRSREREISFAGGRTVYDNLNKDIFEAVPIFIDSLGHFILLDWQYLYKGTIRDFYPPADLAAPVAQGFQLYAESLDGSSSPSDWAAIFDRVGQRINASDLGQYIDFAFLTLHGCDGEDGRIQGLLELLSLPYSGSGIRASSIGIDKAFQKKIMDAGGFATPTVQQIQRKAWQKMENKADFIAATEKKFGAYPIVVRPANQGSSIGVAIAKNSDELTAAIDRAFFVAQLATADFLQLSPAAQHHALHQLTDIRSSLGFPLLANIVGDNSIITHISTPAALAQFITTAHAKAPACVLNLEALNSEQEVILESFIKGKEFSCVVVQDLDGQPFALPPTEIVKGEHVFDYRSKYLPGLARKVTPIDLPTPDIEAIGAECVRLFDFLQFNVYARIDGFIQADGRIFLNDPNTTSGMLPSSFFFHQAAEIGLNPSQFLTYIIYASLQQRIATDTQLNRYDGLLAQLDAALNAAAQASHQKTRIAVLLGGYSSERHISVESGRNIYEKLASSSQYLPTPIFVMHDDSQGHCFYKLPINLLLKDNADDIKDKILHFEQHPIIAKIQARAAAIRARFAPAAQLFAPEKWSYEKLKNEVDAVFIALHGRPGEDGQIQSHLEKLGIPFNGSPSYSAQITINKFDTLQRLKAEGFTVAEQHIIEADSYISAPKATIARIEKLLPYPFIAKPIDDGCSSAVKLVRNAKQLDAFLQLLFRAAPALDPAAADVLKLKLNEEFPQKTAVLLESLIEKGKATHFLEITGGLLTTYDEAGQLQYEIFEPSETLSSGEVLSLEEKFLAGEGQNITPARFASPALPHLSHAEIASQVRQKLQRAAEILGVVGYARIDAFVKIHADSRVETIIIEVNSLPGMTPATCIFHQCALSGYKPAEFIDKILLFGQQRQLLASF
jgi:D-alanine-D-alanine ligase